MRLCKCMVITLDRLVWLLSNGVQREVIQQGSITSKVNLQCFHYQSQIFLNRFRLASIKLICLQI